MTASVPVLVVGGGPIGLALAADLGRRGIRTLLIERNEDRVGSPKMIVVSVRTMEFCRQLGVAPAVRNWGFPLDYPLDSVFCTSLNGYELGRVKTPPLRQAQDTPFSPERERPCPQTWFDPILQNCARRFPQVTLRYDAELKQFGQDETGVTAYIEDRRTGVGEEIRTEYLVGCDGYTSTVRENLGIELTGEKHLDLSMSVYVRIKDLKRFHDKGDAYRYVFIGPEGTWSVLTTIDGSDLWRIQLIGSDELDVRRHDLSALIKRMIGKEVEHTIEDVSLWVRKMTVAQRFSQGRVFLAGDSAHAHPPNGGLGMNTGIQDAFDLGWKLAAVLQGWGGPQLLRSYDAERRPASSRAAHESLRNYRRLTSATRYSRIEDDDAAGARLRAELGGRLVAENEKAWHPIGVHLGYMYDPSPIVVPDGTPRPSDDTIQYFPNARPGSRAPHVWLKDDYSTLDLFGDGFSLLKFDGSRAEAITEAARACRVPVKVTAIAKGEAAALYEKNLVLVRPDGHVAWRGDLVPDDPRLVLDVVRGARSSSTVADDEPTEAGAHGRRQ